MLNVVVGLNKSKKIFCLLSLTIAFSICQYAEIQAQTAAWMNIRLHSDKDKAYTLGEAMGERGALLLFLDPDCPVSQKYGATIRKISNQLKERGIETIAIYPVVNMDITNLKSFIKEYRYDFIHLQDPQLKLTRSIGASVTPEAYLLSDSGEIMYHGAIDNWFYELGRYRRVVTRHYLQDAAAAYLKQKPVLQAKTKAIGCMIGTGMLHEQEHH
ncbi:redoxin family protein [Catalinimonas niigatensis]|uniref:redoxin family protein n=1 Tax=Catalinimonas niigatensis TaxID=1397264 RepID=UPI0026667CE9|nr:redoxin family protein [Catalinimonas niigatensis]WPP49269.1 redoxin family protein [Catalinimonas niigatensis]